MIYKSYNNTVCLVDESATDFAERFSLGQIDLQVDRQMNNRAQVVVSVDTAVLERLGQISLDALDKHVRIDSEYTNERIAVPREQHMHNLHDLHDLALLARLEAVDDNDETRTRVRERVNGAHRVRDDVDFAFQLEDEILQPAQARATAACMVTCRIGARVCNTARVFRRL